MDAHAAPPPHSLADPPPASPTILTPRQGQQKGARSRSILPQERGETGPPCSMCRSAPARNAGCSWNTRALPPANQKPERGQRAWFTFVRRSLGQRGGGRAARLGGAHGTSHPGPKPAAEPLGGLWAASARPRQQHPEAEESGYREPLQQRPGLQSMETWMELLRRFLRGKAGRVAPQPEGGSCQRPQAESCRTTSSGKEASPPRRRSWLCLAPLMKRPAPGAGAEGTETKRSLTLKWPKRCQSRRNPAPERSQTSCLWGPFCWQARPQAASPTVQQEAPPCQLSRDQDIYPEPEIAGPSRSPPAQTIGSHLHSPALSMDRNSESCPAAGVPSEEADGSKGLARAEKQEDQREQKEEEENHAEEKEAEEEVEDYANDLSPDVDESRAGRREEEENLSVESYEESLSTEEGDAASREEEESRGEDTGPSQGGGERREEEQAGPSHREQRRSPERGAGEGEWQVLLLEEDEDANEDED